MRKLVMGVMTVAMAVTMAGCSQPAASDTKTEAAPAEIMEEVSLDEIEAEPELGDYPSNEFEERVGKYVFESYDEIIGLMEGAESYAYVDVLGADEPILLVTSYTYDNLDGNRAAIGATPYLKYPDGQYKAGSVLASGSTATPLAMSEDGCIFVATHSTIGKYCLGENGTDVPGIMTLVYAYEEISDELKPESYGGFIREKNTVIDNDGTPIAEDDDKTIKDLFAEYEKAQVINFTPIDPAAVEIPEE